ncbi:RNA polymerase III RPC4-domain-containing protein [Hypomontagnella monticulosa]|nr:RNA polymerase III RPC4-domain-containing protein [Hypomontagnella monticulosa]
MPPKGSRGGRGGRGRGATRAGRQGDASTRASNDDVTTHPVATPSQVQVATDTSGTAIQNTSSQPISLESPGNLAVPETQGDLPISGTSSRQSRTPSVAPSRAGGRFRPKNIRRDAVERARLEEERNRNLAVKIKEEEREQRAEDRRARRGRGRGDSSQRGFIRRTVTASGPFSAIPQENVKGDGSGWGYGPGGAGASSSKAGFTPEFAKLRYQPRRQNENRINTDLLAGFTGFGDDENSIDENSRFMRSAGNLPMGLIRTEHEESEVKVKTTAELEAEERQSSDDEELFVSRTAEDLRDIALQDNGEVWHAAPKSKVTVKAEPGTEPEGMDVDMTDIPEMKTPPSPEVQKKPLTAEEEAALKKKKLMEKAAKDPEMLQSIYDLEAQLNMLRFKPVTDEDGHVHDEKDNQMYLFQLPPILPPLVKVTEGTDGEASAGANETSQENSDGATASKVKTEEGAEKEKEYDQWADFPKEGGFIGKLNVRKSGKVELDWGGTPLSVGIGGQTDLINTVMMVEQNVDLQNPEKSSGYACGMGMIQGRFVVVPVWSEEEEWNPSLEDIEGLEQ